EWQDRVRRESSAEHGDADEMGGARQRPHDALRRRDQHQAPEVVGASGAIRRFVSRQPIGTFLCLAYLWSWLFWVPSVLLYRRAGVAAVPIWALTIGSYGPTVAALLVALLVEGKQGTRALLEKYITWRVGIWWYGAALF